MENESNCKCLIYVSDEIVQNYIKETYNRQVPLDQTFCTISTIFASPTFFKKSQKYKGYIEVIDIHAPYSRISQMIDVPPPPPRQKPKQMKQGEQPIWPSENEDLVNFYGPPMIIWVAIWLIIAATITAILLGLYLILS